ncbi:hypothetical protein HYALB_00013534 [Hymenoscyphus albidus]|uniref:Uncharacterized protein n=1 Tax=Hymenoscyphus albidus TaxID=595503 RepID=A0A9N9Q4N7_9HELO|nr:hypothetical protein HYALB_00013534 [Hymenoscyphus albidus]
MAISITVDNHIMGKRQKFPCCRVGTYSLAWGHFSVGVFCFVWAPRRMTAGGRMNNLILHFRTDVPATFQRTATRCVEQVLIPWTLVLISSGVLDQGRPHFHAGAQGSGELLTVQKAPIAKNGGSWCRMLAVAPIAFSRRFLQPYVRNETGADTVGAGGQGRFQFLVEGFVEESEKD